MIRRFSRWELKYLITAPMRDALLPVLTAHMRPDPEGGAAGAYRVTSLYWDSLDYSCYRAKIDGINFRRKVRIRRYGELDDAVHAPVMLEIKQRINRTTQKRRLPLALADAYAVLDGEVPAGLTLPADRAVAEEVMFLAGAQQLRPACVISYERQAFVGSSYEPGLRITFDRELIAAAPGSGLGPLGEPHRFLRGDALILEVKSNDVVPIWVSRMLAAEGCQLGHFSKYCSGLAKLKGEQTWTS